MARATRPLKRDDLPSELDSITTPIESPQTNCTAESVVKTLDLKRWFEHYNEKHPHNALDYLPPRRFREKQGQLTNTDGPIIRG